MLETRIYSHLVLVNDGSPCCVCGNPARMHFNGPDSEKVCNNYACSSKVYDAHPELAEFFRQASGEVLVRRAK